MKKPFLSKTVLIAIMVIVSIYIPTISSDETDLGFGTFSTNLYVGGIGPGNYSTIQDAVNNASDGDTVYVYSGTYQEFVDINNSITIQGENKETTIIDGDNRYQAGFDVFADNVTIQGFTIIKYEFVGININTQNNVLISNNIFYNNEYSIWVEETTNLLIVSNKIHDNQCGIFTKAINNGTITLNNITNNTYGIKFEDTISEFINFISSNKFTENTVGIRIQISGGDLYIDHNLIEKSSYAGIQIDVYSLYMWITENIIINGYKGIESNEGFVNHIFHNTFINNTQNARDVDDYNYWDNGYPSGGNFWDDYCGVDNNNDGIGDTPYSIPSDGNADNYPLMHPYGLICNLLPGWNFLSIPLNKTIYPSEIQVLYKDTLFTFQQGLDNGFIAPYFFEWNQTIQSYHFGTYFSPGKGYWVFAYEPCSYWTFKYERNLDSTITSLKPKWNMMSAPYDYTIDKMMVTINSNNNTYSWSDAVTNNIISDSIFGWDALNQTYVFASSYEPEKCYWMYAFEECYLIY